MHSTHNFDAIIIGAGAAGLMCAATAGQRGKNILLLDHADKVGKKILISGGGRCNFTNRFSSPLQYLSQNPHFVKSALRQFSADDFINLVNKHNIPWHEKTLGQLFCDTSAREIVAMLLHECQKGKVNIQLHKEIFGIQKKDSIFTIQSASKTYKTPKLIIATGGPSIPLMGATNFAFEIAKQFSLNVIPPKPALVPLTLRKEDQIFKDLSGVSTDAIVSCGNTQFREAILFTHKGLSGPAILQISSFWNPGDEIQINFFPDEKHEWILNEKKINPRTTLKKLLLEGLPKRLANTLNSLTNNNSELGNIADKKLREIENKLSNWAFLPSGSEGFKKAEVTLGGVDTSELSSKTMEVKNSTGLYFIGEAVDVTGWLGGYNFQWAWSSAVAAGNAI